MNLVLTFCLLLLGNGTYASPVTSSDINIQIEYGSKILIINGNVLTPNDLFSTYVEALGTYDRTAQSSRYTTFYYDDEGITILVNKKTGKVEELNFQYLPQRGTKGTIDFFVGSIIINDRNLLSFRNTAEVTNYYNDMEFTQVMDVLLMTQREGFNIGIVFTQDNQLELCSIQFF